MKKYLGSSTRVDHVAIAVRDLEEALFLYQDVFGFELLKRREVQGAFSGMKSAELDAGGFSIVLVQGTDPQSQVSRYIEEYGPGVQHIAVEVDDVAALASTLSKSGVRFATDIIRGDGLVQIFTQREGNSGMMFEFIQRKGDAEGFEAGNIQKLFDQLETSEAY
ncbi:MAG: Glyoxalase/bleomycin resistance protein/dioxygenase [Paucimonas sp.]|jgi:methylmalonyl-CoA epimerase|nr:Glyoxalase/bleomycin resistance protein/dioxygenase [Paucimonas sp.]